MGDGGRVVGFVTFISLVEVIKCPSCVMEDADVGTFPRNAADLPRMVMAPLRNGVHRDQRGRAGQCAGRFVSLCTFVSVVSL
jgi:hypothetical protein